MPCSINILDQDGLREIAYSANSLAEGVRFEPADGIYTVASTFQKTKTLKLDAHFDRMEQSARLAHVALQLDRHAVRTALRQLIERVNWGDVRFRISVSASDPSYYLLSVEPFSPPSATLIEQGTRCITAENAARHNPEAKTTDWMHQREQLSKAMPPHIYDTFLCDAQGYVLEGLGSNFYAILDGTLRTAGEGVLHGIAQQIVLETAPAILPVELKAIHRDELARCSEAFLTSSSRGIIPVVEIDGKAIGQGKVGEMTRHLRQAYQAWLEAHLEEL